MKITCEQCSDLIFDRLDFRLDSDTRADMDEHLYTCASCRDLLDDQASFDLLLKRTLLEEPVTISPAFKNQLVASCREEQQRRPIPLFPDREHDRQGSWPNWMPMALAACFAALLTLSTILVQPGLSDAARENSFTAAATNMISHGGLASISNSLSVAGSSNVTDIVVQ